MYLAEDRILCWELVSKRGCKWKLHYVKSARATTDVPDAVSLSSGAGNKLIRGRCRSWCRSVDGMLARRREVVVSSHVSYRWLNGSFFAAIHSIVHFGYLYRSSYVQTISSIPGRLTMAGTPLRGSFSSTSSSFTVSLMDS
jgi:chitin synthase